MKYIYLGTDETLLVIVSRKLSKLEEEKLTRILREYKEAIGWTMADIKGLSPSTYTSDSYGKRLQTYKRILEETKSANNRDSEEENSETSQFRYDLSNFG